MKYTTISIVILLVSFISILAYKLTTNNSNNKLSLTKEQMKEMLSYTIDGNSTSSMPTKGSGYKVKSITCKSGSILSWDNDNWLLEVEKLESEDLCNIDFTTGTGSYTVTAVPNIAGSLDSTSKTTTDNGQVTFYTDLAIDSVSGCTNEISDGKVIVKNITGNTTCNINLKFPTLATLIKEKSITHEDGIYEENGYRYEGSDPNNYIYMVNNGSNELWRIIGLFPDGENGEDVIRVRKFYENNSYPTSVYDSGTTAYLNNNQIIIRKNYLAYNDKNMQKKLSVSEPGWEGTNYFPRTTLYNKMKDIYNINYYKNTISYKMYLGTSDSADSYISADLYKMERVLENFGVAGTASGGLTFFVGAVGLMYPSDYGYGVMSSECSRTTNIGGYDSMNDCYSKNWLYKTELQCLLTSGMYHSRSETYYVKKGMLSSIASANCTYSPVMALSNSVKVTGSGTQSDPYVME